MERQQANETSAGATKQMKGFKRWVATKRVEKTGIKRNWWKEDLPETVFQEALATAEKEKRGRRMQVVVPPPRFKVEITWSDGKVGDKVTDCSFEQESLQQE